MEATSILIVGDEPEFIRAYCEAITREPDFRLVGAALEVASGSHGTCATRASIPARSTRAACASRPAAWNA